MDRNKSVNDALKCPVDEDWKQYRNASVESMQTIKALSDSMEHLSEHTKHLPVIAKGIEVMTDKITDMNSTVLSAAIGREQIPLSTVNEMFNQWSKHNATLYRVFGVICLSLVLIIGYLLIGEHFSWIRNLH